jgi:hypothetical protein
MLTGVHQFPNALFALKFLNSYSSEWTSSKALKFFITVHIVAIANIITIDSMHLVGIIRYQGYEFRITWEEINLTTYTELLQHLPRVVEKIHENL